MRLPKKLSDEVDEVIRRVGVQVRDTAMFVFDGGYVLSFSSVRFALFGP